MRKLGPYEIPHPFILAPMSGITHSPFRRLMRRLGSPLVISDLISANGIEYSGERTHQMLRFHSEERGLGLQIFGERPRLLVKAAQVVERVGADFVDLNLGCPVPKVVKKGGGSAMCRKPAELEKVLAAMVQAVKIPVTIKIRTGWDANCKNALDVVRAAENAGVSWVAIHGRTRAQGYSGEADWDFIGEIKAKTSMPIIGNGDVLTPEKAVSRFLDYGLDGVMIGRGALRNPFIFQQASELLAGRDYTLPRGEDYLGLIDQQKDLLDDHYDARMAAVFGRKFLAWYSAGYPGSSNFRKMVFSRDADPEWVWSQAREFFAGNAGLMAARSREHLSQPFLMGGAWVSSGKGRRAESIHLFFALLDF